MVGDDQVDAEFVGPARRLGAADAAVHRDDHLHALGVQPLHGRRLQAVAVAQPLGIEVGDVAAEQFERPPQDDRRGHAVDVVVAVDGNAFAPFERGAEAVDGLAHVGQAERIPQLRQLRVEEALRRLRIGVAAMAQQPRHDGRHVERRGQPCGGCVVTHDGVPDQCPHDRSDPGVGIRRPRRRSRRPGGRCGGTSRSAVRAVRRPASPSGAAGQATTPRPAAWPPARDRGARRRSARE